MERDILLIGLRFEYFFFFSYNHLTLVISPGVPIKPPQAPATAAIPRRLKDGWMKNMDFSEYRSTPTWWRVSALRWEKLTALQPEIPITVNVTANLISESHLVNCKSCCGVGKLPDKRCREPIVERQKAFRPGKNTFSWKVEGQKRFGEVESPDDDFSLGKRSYVSILLCLQLDLRQKMATVKSDALEIWRVPLMRSN